MLPEISILDELPKRHAMEKSVEAESVHSGVEIVTPKKSLNLMSQRPLFQVLVLFIHSGSDRKERMRYKN